MAGAAAAALPAVSSPSAFIHCSPRPLGAFFYAFRSGVGHTGGAVLAQDRQMVGLILERVRFTVHLKEVLKFCSFMGQYVTKSI